MAAVVTLDKHAAPLRAGDLWTAVSTKGMGQPVKIRRVSTNQVYFRAFGRGADESQTFKLPQDAFRVRYAPLSLAEDRRKAMERNDRTEVRREPLGNPVPVNEAIEAAVEAVVTETAAPVAPVVADPPKVGGTPRKLTGEQAREIYQLAREAPHAERVGLAKGYGVNQATIYSILRGEGYAWATEDLRRESPPIRGKSGPKAPRQPAPEPPSVVEPVKTMPQEVVPVQITTPPNIVPPAPERSWQDALKDLRAAQPDPEPERVLLTDLADALDFLLEYAGRPLPKYLMLDLPSLAKLSERARALGGAR